MLQPKFGGCSDTIVFQQLFSHILWLYTHLKFKIIDTKKKILENVSPFKFGLFWVMLDCRIAMFSEDFFVPIPLFALNFHGGKGREKH